MRGILSGRCSALLARVWKFSTSTCGCPVICYLFLFNNLHTAVQTEHFAKSTGKQSNKMTIVPFIGGNLSQGRLCWETRRITWYDILRWLEKMELVYNKDTCPAATQTAVNLNPLIAPWLFSIKTNLRDCCCWRKIRGSPFGAKKMVTLSPLKLRHFFFRGKLYRSFLVRRLQQVASVCLREG